MELIKKYDDFSDVKKEIDRFTDLLIAQKDLPNINELKAIAKYIIFFKTIITFSRKGKCHYKNSLIYDILSTMHSLTNNSIRHFHYIFRSFIENYARSMLDLEDNDETGINQLFKSMNEEFGKTKEAKEILDFISGEYGKSCMYVHSNTKANFNIQLYFTEILSNDDFNTKTLTATINKILLILKKMTELLIYSHPNLVENAFYRRKQRLAYLIGQKSYDIFFEQLKTKN